MWGMLDAETKDHRRSFFLGHGPSSGGGICSAARPRGQGYGIQSAFLSSCRTPSVGPPLFSSASKVYVALPTSGFHLAAAIRPLDVGRFPPGSPRVAKKLSGPSIPASRIILGGFSQGMPAAKDTGFFTLFRLLQKYQTVLKNSTSLYLGVKQGVSPALPGGSSFLPLGAKEFIWTSKNLRVVKGLSV